MRRNRLVLPFRRLQLFDLFEQPFFVLPNLSFDRLEQLQCRPQIEQVLVPPIPGEIPSDLLDGFATARVPLGCQAHWIAVTSDDGANDGQAGGPGQIADGVMDLDVHLVEGLLHPLDATGAFLDQIGHLSLDGS